MTEDFIMLGDKKFANKTRGGYPVRIIATDRRLVGNGCSFHRFVGLVTGTDGSETPMIYDEDGEAIHSDRYNLVLYGEPDKITYRNVYPDGVMGGHCASREKATAEASSDRIAVLAINKTKGTAELLPVAVKAEEPAQEPDDVRWFNVWPWEYSDGSSFIWTTKGNARAAACNAQNVIGVAEVNLTKGTVTVHPVKAEG